MRLQPTRQPLDFNKQKKEGVYGRHLRGSTCNDREARFFMEARALSANLGDLIVLK
jgi:hypothetical protein